MGSALFCSIGCDCFCYIRMILYICIQIETDMHKQGCFVFSLIGLGAFLIRFGWERFMILLCLTAFVFLIGNIPSIKQHIRMLLLLYHFRKYKKSQKKNEQTQ